LEEENYESPQDVFDKENFDNESEESKQRHPLKRQKTVEIFPSNTIPSAPSDLISLHLNLMLIP
jgi:hypothetical protein